jgi:dienelactone hydrolase
MHSRFLVIAALCCAAAFPQGANQRPPYVPADVERTQLQDRLDTLRQAIAGLRPADPALLADVEIYHKAGAWILRYPEEFYTRAYYGHALAVVDRGLERARQLAQRESPWATAKGRVVRAYRSRVDDSVQPYAVHVPDDYDPARPIRLDVVLHGRGATLNEVSFLTQHEQAKPVPLKPGSIELHVFGRTNNAYRWSGETDVFEALGSVRQRYNIDPDRIVLRGFSMGGAGAWHIGLHHPGHWAAVEAGAGFTETIRYARQQDLPPHQLKALRIYDAVDYTPNAFNVPIVGYGGEVDAQLRASLNIKERLTEEKMPVEAIRALFLVGPQTGHQWHPDSRRSSNEFIDRQLPRRVPDHIRFVTYTTRYNRCFWLTVDAMEKHYERAEVDARRTPEGMVVATTSNIARLTLDKPSAATIDGQRLPAALSFEKRNGRWAKAGSTPPSGKHHGLQGPIDDAFMDSFLVVKQTQKPHHTAAALLAKTRMETFLKDYAKWLRADPRVVDDENVTNEQIRAHHLVLFGDTSSNRLIAKIASRMPVKWNKESIQVGSRTLPSNQHLLVAIFPNPLNPDRYVVLNSGHSFGETEFRGTNALLFPRFGDWAVLNVDGEVVTAGLFDEQWRVAGN